MVIFTTNLGTRLVPFCAVVSAFHPKTASSVIYIYLFFNYLTFNIKLTPTLISKDNATIIMPSA